MSYKPFLQDEVKSQWPFIDTDQIPPGFVMVPMLINDNGTKYRSMFLAGQFGKTCDDDCTVPARSDWCVAIIN